MIGLGVLKGANLGQTFVRCIFAILVAVVAYQAASGAFAWWRADVWKERAEENKAAAVQAEAKAESANAGAANATETRQRVDLVLTGIPAKTEASAQRIESHADRPAPVADLDPVDPDVVREIDDGEESLRAAADRLQRTGSGRPGAAAPEPRRATRD